jgi:leader peptidase (prepilin peptidase)/N-methyltransferase
MESIISTAFIVLLCLFFASFLNVAAIRIPRRESIICPPSHCMTCDHQLRPFDLFPVLSYLWLKGKCRYCRIRISPVYPAGELFTTLLLLFTYYRLAGTQELWIAIPLMGFLAVITISDLLYKIIPNKINFIGWIYFTISHLFNHPLPYYDYILGSLLGGGLLLLISVLSRGGMGGGDIKLMAVIGMAIGWKLALLSFFLASLLGGVVGVILLLIGKVHRRQLIPFGPFLALGTILSYFLGHEMIQTYMNFFLRSP